jgi:N-acetylneuraminic acid mutarotase
MKGLLILGTIIVLASGALWGFTCQNLVFSQNFDTLSTGTIQAGVGKVGNIGGQWVDVGTLKYDPSISTDVAHSGSHSLKISNGNAGEAGIGYTIAGTVDFNSLFDLSFYVYPASSGSLKVSVNNRTFVDQNEPLAINITSAGHLMAWEILDPNHPDNGSWVDTSVVVSSGRWTGIKISLTNWGDHSKTWSGRGFYSIYYDTGNGAGWQLAMSNIAFESWRLKTAVNAIEIVPCEPANGLCGYIDDVNLTENWTSNMLDVVWRLGFDYPLGIQGPAMGYLNGSIIESGGFTRCPENVRSLWPDAFPWFPGVVPNPPLASSGWTQLTLNFDPNKPNISWGREYSANWPSPLRQDSAYATVNNYLYAIGGFNTTSDSSTTYQDAFRLSKSGSTYSWDTSSVPSFPWPITDGSAVSVGSKLYVLCGSDFFDSADSTGTSPSSPHGADFHSETGRGFGTPIISQDFSEFSPGPIYSGVGTLSTASGSWRDILTNSTYPQIVFDDTGLPDDPSYMLRIARWNSLGDGTAAACVGWTTGNSVGTGMPFVLTCWVRPVENSDGSCGSWTMAVNDYDDVQNDAPVAINIYSNNHLLVWQMNEWVDTGVSIASDSWTGIQILVTRWNCALGRGLYNVYTKTDYPATYWTLAKRDIQFDPNLLHNHVDSVFINPQSPSGGVCGDITNFYIGNCSPVGYALMMLDTNNLAAGWQRKADLPGVARGDAGVSVVGNKIYVLGGQFDPFVWDYSDQQASGSYPHDGCYLNVRDSWVYDTTTDSWTQLADMPDGANRTAVTCNNRYILLLGGYKYPWTKLLTGTAEALNSTEQSYWQPGGDPDCFFQNTVLAYDTNTGTLGRVSSMLDRASIPDVTSIGSNIVYVSGGEGGNDLWHPKLIQIARVRRAAADNYKPVDKSIGADVTTQLTWYAGIGATSHNVFYGTDYSTVLNATTPNGTVSDSNTYTASSLSYNTVYYWRVDEVAGGTTTKGDVWSFRTMRKVLDQSFESFSTGSIYTGIGTTASLGGEWRDIGTTSTYPSIVSTVTHSGSRSLAIVRWNSQNDGYATSCVGWTTSDSIDVNLPFMLTCWVNPNSYSGGSTCGSFTVNVNNYNDVQSYAPVAFYISSNKTLYAWQKTGWISTGVTLTPGAWTGIRLHVTNWKDINGNGLYDVYVNQGSSWQLVTQNVQFTPGQLYAGINSVEITPSSPSGSICGYIDDITISNAWYKVNY